MEDLKKKMLVGGVIGGVIGGALSMVRERFESSGGLSASGAASRRKYRRDPDLADALESFFASAKRSRLWPGSVVEENAVSLAKKIRSGTEYTEKQWKVVFNGISRIRQDSIIAGKSDPYFDEGAINLMRRLGQDRQEQPWFDRDLLARANSEYNARHMY